MSPKPGAFLVGALLNNTTVSYAQTAAFGGGQYNFKVIFIKMRQTEVSF